MFQNKVRRYVFVPQIDPTLLSMFCTWSVTLWKIVSSEPPYPSEITAFEPPLPLEISNDLPWGGGGGLWIFSGTTQLMNEAEHLMKNYEDRGGCYPSRL